MERRRRRSQEDQRKYDLGSLAHGSKEGKDRIAGGQAGRQERTKKTRPGDAAKNSAVRDEKKNP
jgi:hypothetical protein